MTWLIALIMFSVSSEHLIWNSTNPILYKPEHAKPHLKLYLCSRPFAWRIPFCPFRYSPNSTPCRWILITKIFQQKLYYSVTEEKFCMHVWWFWAEMSAACLLLLLLLWEVESGMCTVLSSCRQRGRLQGGRAERIVAQSHRPCLPLALRRCTSVEQVMLVGGTGLIFIPASAILPALWLTCWCSLLQWWESSHMCFK